MLADVDVTVGLCLWYGPPVFWLFVWWASICVEEDIILCAFRVYHIGMIAGMFV